MKYIFDRYLDKPGRKKINVKIMSQFDLHLRNQIQRITFKNLINIRIRLRLINWWKVEKVEVFSTSSLGFEIYFETQLFQMGRACISSLLRIFAFILKGS